MPSLLATPFMDRYTVVIFCPVLLLLVGMLPLWSGRGCRG
ncbi:hypothetical protein HMPREF3198_00118 [Winkia neuii]|nr:hypothetical protein HMPREF3198_00118 [Winkia neuii]